MHIQRLPKDYTLVLQRLQADGTDEFENLVETLRFERSRLAHIIQALNHKGLVLLKGDDERGFWLSLSSKGRRTLAYLWPEGGGLQPSF